MRLLMCGVVLLIPISHATAQSVPSMRGQWVRVSTKFEGADPDWLLARVTDLTPAYLVVDPLAAGPLAIMRESLTQLQLFRGWVSKKRQGTIVGAAAGLAAAAAAAVVLDCPAYCFAGVPLGAGIGRAVGASASGFAWSQIPLDRLDAAFARREVARVFLGATVSF